MVLSAAYEDGFTLRELTRKHYREAGLDALKLNLLVRSRYDTQMWVDLAQIVSASAVT